MLAHEKEKTFQAYFVLKSFELCMCSDVMFYEFEYLKNKMQLM